VKKADKDHIVKAVSLGCIVCYNLGYFDTPAEYHHLLNGAGMSQRSPHKRGIPLCHFHHRTGGYGVAIHAGQKEWEKRYGTELELYEQVMEMIG